MKLYNIAELLDQCREALEEMYYLDKMIAGMYAGLKTSPEFRELRTKKDMLDKRYLQLKETLRELGREENRVNENKEE